MIRLLLWFRLPNTVKTIIVLFDRMKTDYRMDLTGLEENRIIAREGLENISGYFCARSGRSRFWSNLYFSCCKTNTVESFQMMQSQGLTSSVTYWYETKTYILSCLESATCLLKYRELTVVAVDILEDNWSAYIFRTNFGYLSTCPSIIYLALSENNFQQRKIQTIVLKRIYSNNQN